MKDNTKNRWSCAIKAILTLTLMILGALAMLAAAIVTLFRARRFYSEWMASPLGRLTLRVWGIQLVVHDRPQSIGRQCVYISNHSCTVDVFVLIALGLPDTRFFLSGFLRKVLPLGLIGYLIGIFWTVPQKFPERRMEIFRRADHILKRTGESVYLSPEGRRVTTGEVGNFNKGAFHLATSLGAPIVPFYIRVPPGMNPGKSYCAQPGRVDVYFKPEIGTTDWRVEDIVRNKERVRDQFLEWHRDYS